LLKHIKHGEQEQNMRYKRSAIRKLRALDVEPYFEAQQRPAPEPHDCHPQILRLRFKLLNLVAALRNVGAAIKQRAPKSGYTLTNIAPSLELAAHFLVQHRRTI
jgi:hypothetical protein